MIRNNRPGAPLTVSLRALLLQALTELALELGCSAVLTGHTATDRAETLLVNLVRGAGADGMQVRSIDPLSSPLLPSLPLQGIGIDGPSPPLPVLRRLWPCLAH